MDDIIVDMRRLLADWFGGHGVADPEGTAAVLIAAIDGVLMHRAVRPDLTAASVAPVLRAILAPATDERHERKAGDTS